MEYNRGLTMMKNTVFLYTRMFLIMCISLVSVRLLLKYLGVEDYGINNVVAGFVLMLSFLSTSLASGMQRFFSFSLARKDIDGLNRFFSTGFVFFLILCLVAILIAETIGIWFVQNKMTIPPDRMEAAKYVFHFSIVSFAATMLLIPFSAMVLSNEHMGFYSIVSVIDAILRLGIVCLLSLCKGDRLILYSGLFASISILNIVLYFLYCKNQYRFLSFKICWNKDALKQLFEYCGWYTFGSFSVVIRSQGINVLINLFFSPVVNAARGVAFSVNHAITNFVNSFYSAIRPQIIKRFSANETKSMMSLVLKSTKLSYYLLILAVIPLLLEMPYILQLWLQVVPEHTVAFTRIVVIIAVVETLGMPLTTAICSNGDIKWYQIITGGITLLNLPISYLFLKLGYFPEVTMIIALAISVIVYLTRIGYMRKLFELNLKSYITLILRLFLLTLLALSVPLILHLSFPSSFLSFIIVILSSLLISALIIWFIGLEKDEKGLLKTWLRLSSKRS